MYKSVSNQVLSDVVTLDEAKAQLNIESSFDIDDDYINSLIGVSTELAQNYVNRLLSVADVTACYEGYQSSYQLWGGGVTSITSVSVTDSLGYTTVVPADEYRFNAVSQKLTIQPQWEGIYEYNVVYQAGMTEIPKAVKQGVLYLISTMYNVREDVTIGMTVANMPITSTALLNSVKYYES